MFCQRNRRGERRSRRRNVSSAGFSSLLWPPSVYAVGGYGGLMQGEELNKWGSATRKLPCLAPFIISVLLQNVQRMSVRVSFLHPVIITQTMASCHYDFRPVVDESTNIINRRLFPSFHFHSVVLLFVCVGWTGKLDHILWFAQAPSWAAFSGYSSGYIDLYILFLLLLTSCLN